MRGARTLEYFVFLKICCKYFFELFFFLLSANSCSHVTSCALCAKAKAACKPFDMDKAQAKARMETI